jgi:hypothetical protein
MVSSNKTRQDVANAYEAEFHDVIRPTIPIFTDWLTGPDHHVRLAAASALARLAERGE